MDSLALKLLDRFEARADQVADDIAAATVAEVDGFGPARDSALHAEVRALARRHLDAYLEFARHGGPPSPEMMAAAGQRASARARELVPLAALLHSYLIAQRIISGAIALEAGSDSRSRGAALQLMATTFDYNIAMTTAMADAYVESVQGDLAALDIARAEVIDELLRAGPDTSPELTRRALSLGLDPTRGCVVVVAAVDPPDGEGGDGAIQRTVEAIAQAAGGPRRNTFLTVRDRTMIAVLKAGGATSPRRVLDQAAAAMRDSGRGLMRAGIGSAFNSLGGFAASYHEARRALRHSRAGHPLVFSPGDVGVFAELLLGRDETVAQLVPEGTRRTLANPRVAGTIQAFIDADLRVADAAKALEIHPNSLRYRLRRIAEQTGLDPRKVNDLLELIAASRVIARAAEPAPWQAT